MSTPNEVLISGERHLIILGQIGNLQAKVAQLEHLIRAAEAPDFLPFLAEIEEELGYLKDYYPALDGGVLTHAKDARSRLTEAPGMSVEERTEKARLRRGLRDMRALADAAIASYAHEGAIACHLKVMFDEAWLHAAKAADLDGLDDIPF